MLALDHNARAVPEFLGSVVEQQRTPVLAKILLLREIFFSRFLRNEISRPDLAMRMGVGTSHRRALVLEDLYPAVPASKIGALIDPCRDDACNLLLRHLGE